MKGEQWTPRARAMRHRDAEGRTAGERAVDLLRAHPDMSVDAIGAAVGISHQRVSQLAKKAGISRAALRSERKATRLKRIAAERTVAAQERSARRMARKEERKRAFLDALRAFYAEQGRSPTKAELGTRHTTERVRSLPLAMQLVWYFGSTRCAFELAGIPCRPRGRRRHAA